MKRFIFIIGIFCLFSYSYASIVNDLSKPIHAENLEFEITDGLLTTVVKNWRIDGLPINMERPILVEGKDYTYTKKGRYVSLMGKTISYYINSNSRNETTLYDYLNHYIDQFDRYRLLIDKNQLSVVPKDDKALTQTIIFPSFEYQDITLNQLFDKYDHLYNEHGLFYSQNLIYIGFGKTRDNKLMTEDMLFDIKFEGGPLRKLLFKIVTVLNREYPDYYFYWSLGGKGGKPSFRMSKIERTKYLRLFK